MISSARTVCAFTRRTLPPAPIVVSLALAAVLAAIGGCNSQPGGNPHKIKIVSSLPRTGSAKAQSDTIVNGIKMAIEEAGHKVGDFEIEYADLDDATAAAGQWTAEAERANATRSAADPDVMAYIGPFNSGAAKISMDILNRAHLLMISPSVSAPALTKPGKGDPGEPHVYRPTGKVNFFRVVPTDDLQGPLGADWAKELGVKKVYVLDDNQVYGKGIATLFMEHCQEIGIEVLGNESIDEKATEFKSTMTTIKGLAPDMVYFGGTTQTKAGQLAKDMVAVGLDCKFMVPDGCFEPAFIESAGAKNLEGHTFITFGGLPPEELKGHGAKFVENYEKKFGSTPQAYAAYGYECANAVLEAIRRAGKKDREAVVAGCQSIDKFEGALGTWGFDVNGDTTLRIMSGNVVKDGKFAFAKALGKDAK